MYLFNSHPLFTCLNWLWKPSEASVINPFRIWSLFIIRMLVVSSVLDKIKWKTETPPPFPQINQRWENAAFLPFTRLHPWFGGNRILHFHFNLCKINLGQNKWKTYTPPPPPKSNIWKCCVFALQTASSLIYILYYSVQDHSWKK